MCHNTINCPCFGCRQPFRFLLNNGASELYDHFTNLNWASLEPRPHEVEHEEEGTSSGTSSPGVLDEQQLFLPGSGITKKLYSLRYSMLALLILLMFIMLFTIALQTT